jgi:hypothetical protein
VHVTHVEMGGIVPVALIAAVLVRYRVDRPDVGVKSPARGGDQALDRAESRVAHPPGLDARYPHLLHPCPDGELTLAEIGGPPHPSQQRTEVDGFHGPIVPVRRRRRKATSAACG